MNREETMSTNLMFQMEQIRLLNGDSIETHDFGLLWFLVLFVCFQFGFFYENKKEISSKKPHNLSILQDTSIYRLLRGYSTIPYHSWKWIQQGMLKACKTRNDFCLFNREPQSDKFLWSLEKYISKYFWEADLLLKGLDTL